MTGIIVFVTCVLILQVVLFFVIRNKKKKEREESVIERYNIRSSADAFHLIQDPEVPEIDKEKIEQLYRGDEEGFPPNPQD